MLISSPNEVMILVYWKSPTEKMCQEMFVANAARRQRISWRAVAEDKSTGEKGKPALTIYKDFIQRLFHQILCGRAIKTSHRIELLDQYCLQACGRMSSMSFVQKIIDWFRRKWLCLVGTSAVVLKLSWAVAPSKDSQHIVTFGLCNITAKLPSKGLCSWPPDNRSVAPKGGRGPRLRNPRD